VTRKVEEGWLVLRLRVMWGEGRGVVSCKFGRVCLVVEGKKEK
jgi:hypothetical protein